MSPRTTQRKRSLEPLSLCRLGLSNESETSHRAKRHSPLSGFVLLADGSGFSWLRSRAHSELQQLWDYSSFMDLSKEPQTCWAGEQPGPQHPGSCKSSSSNPSANGFHTSSESFTFQRPNRLQDEEEVLTLESDTSHK